MGWFMKNWFVKFFVFYLGGFLGCSSVAPRLEFGAMVVPDWPGAKEWPELGAVVLDNRYQVFFRGVASDGRIEARVIQRRRVKILSERGFEFLKWCLPSGTDAPIQRAVVRWVEPGGPINKAENVELVEDWEGVDGSSSLRYCFDNLRVPVGAVVEYQYERLYPRSEMLPTWSLGERLPVLRAEVRVFTPQGVDMMFRSGTGEDLVDVNPVVRKWDGNGRQYIYVFKGFQPLYLEPNRIHPARDFAWFMVAPTRGTRRGQGYFRMKEWRDFLPELQVAAQKQPKGSLGANQLLSILNRELQSFRKEYFDFLSPGCVDCDLGGGIAAQGDHVFQGKKAALLDLQERLDAVGIRSEPILFSSSELAPVVQDLVGLYAIAGFGLAIDVEQIAAPRVCLATNNFPTCYQAFGKRYWLLDPYCVDCVVGEERPAFMGVPVFFSRQWTYRDVIARKIDSLSMAIVLDGTEEGGSVGIFTVEGTGVPARWVREACDLGGEKRSRKIACWDALGLGKMASDVTLTEVEGTEVGIKIHGEFMAPVLGTTATEVSVQDLFGSTFPWNLRSVRSTGRRLPAPMALELTFRWNLPKEIELEAPLSEVERGEYWELLMDCGGDEEGVQCVRTARYRQRFVTAKNWPRFQQLVAKTRKWGKKRLRLLKK